MDLLSRIAGWFRGRQMQGDLGNISLDKDGLMFDDVSPESSWRPDKPTNSNGSAVKAVAVTSTGSTTLASGARDTGRSRPESLEKLQAGFERLINELSGINEHLRKQAAQHEQLITRIDMLPKLLENFPGVIENQKTITDGLLEQLKANLLKDKQFIETIEKIPAETARQTDTLESIDRQLSAAAEVDVQMTDTFNKFNESLDRLNHSTQQHSDGISQMSRTFAASDRYLKFIVSRQTRQFMWVFYSALVVCVVVILVLVGLVIYLAR
jgi:methyl-accepting chemotaxis protein